MASRNKMASQPGGDEEMTVVILRFNGSGETLRKGFDTVSQALSMLGQPAAAPRLPQRQRALADGNGHAAAEAEGEVIDAETEEIDADSPEPAKQGGSGSQRRKHVYKFLPELDLKAGETSFKDYCEQKNPKSETDRYLTAAAWLTDHGGAPVFSMNHLFTCFRAASWKELGDFSQPMRRMKADKSYFENPKRAEWKLTGVGKDAAASIQNPKD